MIVFQGSFPLSNEADGDLLVTSVTASPFSVTVVFNFYVALTGNASVYNNWTITDGLTPPTVTGVSVSTNTVTINTTEDITGQTRTLTIPDGVVKFTDSGQALQPPFVFTFASAGGAPYIESIANVDARYVDVVFSEPMVESEALVKANYNVSPTLTILTVAKVQDNRYRLTFQTSQVPTTVYTVTASNIHDLAGNVI